MLAAKPRPAEHFSLDAVWRASELSQACVSTIPSGYAGLDAELPGAGWPCGHLIEVLQTQAGLHEWRLLVPALRACQEAAGQSPGALVFIGCPHPLNLSALACRGIPSRGVLWVDVAQPADRLWAAEQALRCQDLAALLLWSPQVRPEQLRRLQVAAVSHSTGPTVTGAITRTGDKQHRPPPLVFVFRPWAAQRESSPAPLRAGLRLAAQGQLEVHLLKRRGPLLHTPVLLPMDLPAAVLARQPEALSPPTSLALAPAPSRFRDALVNPTDHAVDRPRAAPLPGRSLSADQPLAA